MENVKDKSCVPSLAEDRPPTGEFQVNGTATSQVINVIVPTLLTSTEAARYLRCAVKTLYNLKAQGKICGTNRGGTKKGQLLFRPEDLDDYIFGKRR